MTDPVAPTGEQQVEITLAAETGGTGAGDGPATRATNQGDHKDSYINSLRVMGFRTLDGTLAFNNLVLYNFSSTTQGFTGKILVNTGRYTLVLIANEHADTSTDSMHRKLEALQPGVTTLNDLADMWFPSGKTFDSTKNIPMIALVDDVKITPTGAIGNPLPGTTNLNNSGEPLRIMMKRLGIRLDLKVEMYAEQIDEWWSISNGAINIGGIPDRVYLLPRENSGPVNNIWIYRIGSKPDTAGKEGLITGELPRIILPETVFLPVTDKTRALSISIDGDGKTRRGIIAIDRGATDAGYTIPRNSYLNVTATAKPDWLDVTAEAVIEDWDDENLNQEL
jgi:hypothetical protein